MARIINVHHVDKDAFLRGNIEPDLHEFDLVFERSPTYAELLEGVRIDMNWMDPRDVVSEDEITCRPIYWSHPSCT